MFGYQVRYGYRGGRCGGRGGLLALQELVDDAGDVRRLGSGEVAVHSRGNAGFGDRAAGLSHYGCLLGVGPRTDGPGETLDV